MASKIIMAGIALVVLIIIIAVGYIALSNGKASGHATGATQTVGGNTNSASAAALVSQANANSSQDYNGSGLTSSPVVNGSTQSGT